MDKDNHQKEQKQAESKSVKKSLAKKLLKIVLSMYFVVVLSINLGHMVYEYYLTKNNIILNLKASEKIFGKGLGETLWNADMDSLEAIITGMLEHPVIIGVRIIDDVDEEITARGVFINDKGDYLSANQDEEPTPVDPKQYGVSDRLFWHTFPLVFIDEEDTNEVGTATVYSSTRFIFERVRGGYWLLMIKFFLILLALVSCLILSLKTLVLEPLFMISSVAHRLADFDLTVSMKIHRNDEVGLLLTAINAMVQSFRKVLGQVQKASVQVSSSAAELSTAVKRQKVTMINQVESVDKVVKSAELISAVATVLVETMQRVASMSQETAGFASSGQADLTRMEEVMQNMGNASKAISSRLEAINQKAENITAVVTTITKVADQTNLLSLNAAIEAEKAGEYGRGFAVVAREIRRLADQTALATLDIEQMVGEMQSAVSAGVMEMDKFIAEVRRSTEDVSKISTQLTRIIEQVQTLLPNFEDVNVAMERQSENAQEINAAMMNLSGEMQQTTDSLQETYSAIEQLNEAARGLQNEVLRFKMN